MADLPDLFELPRLSPLRRAPGRETFLADVGGAGRVVVKHYSGGLRAARAARVEHRSLVALRALGIPAVEPVAWAQRSRESLCVLRLVRHDETLAELLARAAPAERARRAAELVELVARLHRAGWYHRDLYLEHFLVEAESGRLCLIDCGRARRDRWTRRRWFVKDVAALLHSTPEAVPRAERLRFLARYLDARGLRSRRERRTFAAAVLAKRRRMAAHVPRHGESFELPAEVRG